MSISAGMQVDTPAAGVVFSLTGGRMPLCFTCPKTFNAFVRLFFVLVFSFGGLCCVQGSEPPFGEGFSQTALFIVLFSFSQCMFSSSPLLIDRLVAAFSLLCFISGCIEYLELYNELNLA